MAEPKPPPSADRLRRFPRALPAGLGGSPALLAPGFRVSAWNQVWNQAPFLGAGFRSRFRGICSRSRGSGPVSHGPFLTARFSGLVRQGPLRGEQFLLFTSSTRGLAFVAGAHFRVGLPGCRPCQRPVRWIHPLDLSVGLSVDRRQPAECLSHTLSPPSGGGGLDFVT